MAALKYYALVVCICLANYCLAQATVKGAVANNRKHPLADASVYVKGTATAATTDSTGHFVFTVKGKGVQAIVASFIGFKEAEKQIDVNDTVVEINFVLQPEEKALEPVVVSAGSFEASDKAKGASLTPMDAMTVAGNGGDIANSLRALPGTQQIGDKEGLFVRGGTSEEAKQFVDGTLLKSPNYGSVPGIMQPARLNPFLFKGILFNTGGYSALYGQALSSALILETIDLPDKSSASLHIFPMSVGAGFQDLARNKKSSYGINTNYGSYALYNEVVKQQPDFFHSPEYIETDANFRIKTSKTGMLKFYTNYGYNHTGMRNANIDSSDLVSSFETRGRNLYANLSYRESLSPGWKIDAGLAYNYNKQIITNKLEDGNNSQLFIPYFPFNNQNNTLNSISNFAQARMVFTKMLTHNQALRFGAEHFYNRDDYHSNDTFTTLKDDLTALFAEADVYVAKNIAAKIGARAEYSSLLKKMNWALRLSFAYRFNDGGQVNLAYGVFYQKPELIYLIQNRALESAQATHYIINYQKKANNRLIRVEAYYKKYKDLVTTTPVTANDGSGFAKGIELFFRDKRTFKNFDYWITYTWLDTKRKFLNYPYALQPNFATPHTASLAIKRFFQDINLSANLSYTLATGRPYYNIQYDAAGKLAVLDQGTAAMYNQMNVSFAYLFNLFKKWRNRDFSGIGFGVNNVFGTKQVFGYNYSYNRLYKMAITQPAPRSYYVGLFMSFGIDRRDDFINEKL
ncbi:MAG: TonB-dependent receptor [Niastella sp.]|uniref:TonB-dependent receptor n=1 Tax=Niastella sp. TaxID=1869183 RepID=UPI00389A4564